MRLIDADETARHFSALQEGASMRDHIYLMGVLSVIDNAPTIEAEPVRHGSWINIEGFMACSWCGTSPADWEEKPDNPLGLPPYCHSCGAKMDAKEEV